MTSSSAFCSLQQVRSGKPLAELLRLTATTVSEVKHLITIWKFVKAPTLRLKALNKHSIAHIMYIEWKCYQQ